MKRGALRLALYVAIATIVSVPTAIGSQVRGPVSQHVDDNVLFDPQHQKPIGYKDGAVNINLLIQGEKLSLSIQKHDKPATAVPLPGNMMQVNDITRAQPNKVVVIGMVNGDVWSVAVISLDALSVSDNFLCYEPAISPDGRYIAFIKFFPPHGAEDVEDHYMLYDLSKDASRNRPVGVSSTDWKTVGFTVYPVGIGNKEFDNLHHSESSAHMLASAGFFWGPTSKSLVFADSYNEQTSIVLVEIGSQEKATTKIAEVVSTCDKNLPESASCSVRLMKATFGASADQPLMVVLQGTLKNSGYQDTLALRPSQFRALGTTEI